MTTVKPRFFSCLMDLQTKKLKVYTWQEIGEALSMSRQAAQNLFMNTPSDNGFIKYATLASLMDFFAREGMSVNLDDLFEIVESPEKSNG